MTIEVLRLATTTIALSALAVGGAPAAPAGASTPPPAPTTMTWSHDARQAAEMFLAENGVSAAIRKKLSAALEKGVAWDSFSGSHKPVTSTTTRIGTTLRTLDTYPDGSIAVVSVQSPSTGAVRPLGVSGCARSGSSYSNCKVDMWVGLVSMSFMASYNTSTNSVTNAYGPSATILGACGVEKRVYRPARDIGRLDVQAQMCVIPHSKTFWLQLRVSGGKPTVSWSA
jgi:hypothetical protein